MAVEERVMAPNELPEDVEEYLFGLRLSVEPDGNVRDIPVPDEAAPAVDPSLAPRLARRRARLAQRLAERRASVAAEIRRLTEWANAENERDEYEAGRIDLLLGNILAAERERDPKRKTLTLPYGVTVAARKVPAAFKRPAGAEAERGICAWLFATDPKTEAVEHRPHLKWDELKKRLRVAGAGTVVFADTGETVPPHFGITYEPEHESVTVKVSTEGTDA